MAIQNAIPSHIVVGRKSYCCMRRLSIVYEAGQRGIFRGPRHMRSKSLMLRARNQGSQPGMRVEIQRNAAWSHPFFGRCRSSPMAKGRLRCREFMMFRSGAQPRAGKPSRRNSRSRRTGRHPRIAACYALPCSLQIPKKRNPRRVNDCPGALDLVLRALDNQRGHISC